MVFNATFNNISVLSWQSVLLVEKTTDLSLTNFITCSASFVISQHTPTDLQQIKLNISSSDKLFWYFNIFKIRSENSMLLHPPNDVRTKSYGERRFDKAAPTLWNSLPLSLRNVNSLDIFKRELKTHFFRIAFKNFL